MHRHYSPASVKQPLPIALAVAAFVCACTSTEAAGPQQTVRIFKSLGSVQCSGGGSDLAALSRQLATAGVRIESSTCGTDGRMHTALCGANDGRIAIFEVEEKDLQSAAKLGFASLTKLPEATSSSCQ